VQVYGHTDLAFAGGPARSPDSVERFAGFQEAMRTGRVLDQSMIMASLDNALAGNALQHHFASDPAAWAAHVYLSAETMSIN
jgi:DNA-binding LacI/PurR family transcriptional regulator